MAQYGNNFYGASYYGRRGTFGGQYVSEEISTGNALRGGLDNTTLVVLPMSTYDANDSSFSYDAQPETYLYNNENYVDLQQGNVATIKLIGSDFKLAYLKTPIGGIADIIIDTYIDGAQVGHTEGTFDAWSAGEEFGIYSSPQLEFGEQRISISINSESSGDICLSELKMRTADISIEVRSKKDDEAFTQWEVLDLNSNVVVGTPNCFELTGATSDYNGKNFYQFKVMLGSSDNTTSPLVKSCKFTSGDSSNFSKAGEFKMRVDLQDVESLSDVTFHGTTPEGTRATIRTRTSGIDPHNNPSWTSWSAPYTDSEKRVRLKSYDLLSNNNPVSEYIITPVLNPQEDDYVTLLSWINFIAEQYVTDQNTKIKYQVLSDDLTRMTYVDNIERWIEYVSRENGNVACDIGEAKNSPIRIKIIITRTQGALSSPVVDVINYSANARYEEFKDFNLNSGFKSYVSAVYGDNTGIVDLTFGDAVAVGDGTIAAPENLGFTIPTPIGDNDPILPTYSIQTTNETFGKYRAGEELNLFWKSQSGEINKSVSTLDPSDNIVAQAKAWPENNLSKGEAELFKHYQYGRGYIIYPNTIETVMTNVFEKPISDDLEHSYYLDNGWVSSEGTVRKNDNINVKWGSNPNSNITEISEANGSLSGGTLQNDSVIISVPSGNTQGEVPWVSEEKIFETVLNEDGFFEKKVIELSGSDLPEIGSNVAIGANPYKIEIVYRSVECNGKIVPEDRIGSEDDEGNSYPLLSYGEDSFESVTVERAPVVRKSSLSGKYLDVLPHARITSILGVYKNDIGPIPDNPEDRPASYYNQDSEFQLIGNYIDWSIAYDENGDLINGKEAPSEDEVYYVSYTYDLITKAYADFRCKYKEYETSRELWTSDTVKKYTASCSPGHDYRSDSLPEKIDVESWGEVPSDVDIETLSYTVYDDNLWVNTFLDDNVVVGTLRNRVPSVNWFPKVHNGYYYLGQEEYYLFTEPIEYTPEEKSIEKAVNVKYEPGRYGNGIFLEEGTANLVLNSGFENANSRAIVFSDSFTREV